ncbi:MAG: CocE/NonD family hydrolase [Gemmatimonadetes bacterium]|nr:CocE/NonD family hydrolase [Gemmatimonadota bacterium]
MRISRRDTAASPAVRAFVIGANRWEEADRWPLPGARERVYFPPSRGSAGGTGTAAGTGLLLGRRPKDSAADSYRYDPSDPVPTVGGANFHLFHSNLGPLDQREVEQRRDVLSYTTPPFDAGAVLAGPVSATLYVSSTARDADFTAKLVLVRPDGYARIVEDGIIRARYHDSLRRPELRARHHRARRHSARGGRGARLRLEVSSGNFPKYDRNPQTGENPATATVLAPATHTVHHGGAYPAALRVWLRKARR